MTNNQPKEPFSEVLKRISKETFREKYLELSRDELRAYFNIGHSNLVNFIKYHHLEDIVEEAKQLKRKKRYQNKANNKLANLINKAPKDSFIEYYINQNHSIDDTCIYFNITMNEAIKLIQEYDCRKDHKLSAVHTLITKDNRYGDSGYNNREQAKETCLEKYGVENPGQVPEFTSAGYATKVLNRPNDPTNITKNFQTRINNSGSLENSYLMGTENRIRNNLEKYGVSNPAKLPEIREAISNSLQTTFMERYGSTCYWTMEDAKRSNGSKDSSFNLAFANLLDNNNINYEREFKLHNFIYDFKINNILIEINPTPTHNITWSPYPSKIDEEYHLRKSSNAEKNGFRCIHIWDWDDINKIIHLLQSKTKIYARKCIIKLVSKKDAILFINNYHLQGYAKDEIRLGLYYENNLVSIMTFGKPRYNKNYQYELIRYCSSNKVIGGAEKLFKYFLINYSPSSIISYCDRSKFSGNIYLKLGFKFKQLNLSKHWYNLKTKKHILDSLLRARGFDQLLGKEYGTYGKGSNNYELMRNHGFVELIDAGQASYIYNNSTK